MLKRGMPLESHGSQWTPWSLSLLLMVAGGSYGEVGAVWTLKGVIPAPVAWAGHYGPRVLSRGGWRSWWVLGQEGLHWGHRC